MIDSLYKKSPRWGECQFLSRLKSQVSLARYYEKSKILFTRPGELVGFTGTTVSIKRNRIVYVYNERGGIISTHAV